MGLPTRNRVLYLKQKMQVSFSLLEMNDLKRGFKSNGKNADPRRKEIVR